MIDIDFMTEPLPGAELHTLLAKLRADGPVADEHLQAAWDA